MQAASRWSPGKVAQGAYILGCEGATLSESERGFFREADPWGFILFARNVTDPDSLARLTSDLRDAVGRDAPVLIDQEGGRVQRMGPPHWPQYLPPLDQMERVRPQSRQRAMYLRYLLIGSELREVGIDVNCAPTADIVTPQTHEFLRNRLYGGDPETVTKTAMAVVEGLSEAGVAPVMKHLPGHGRARADSHLDLPRVDTPRAELERVDFAPFRALSDLQMAMTAHIVFSDLDPDRPATTSPLMIRTIREDIGYDNLLMTDDISMQALDGDVVERALAARAAGCDMVLHCNGERDEMERIAGRVGLMGPSAQTRADRAADARPAPVEVDLDAARDEYEGLLA